MKWANSLRRWTMRSIHSMILGASLLGSADLAIGQTAALKASAVKLPPQVYSRNLGFELPMNMSDNWRAKVSEFQLYSKTPTTDWKLYKSGPQSLQKFDCKVPQDGEYWYTLMTIDLAGKATPPDVNSEPPSQRVVVDTTVPIITVQGGAHGDGELCLRCTMQDANPDLSSLRAAYKTDNGDIPLDPVPNQPGTFRLKGTELIQFPVVVTGTDLAKNQGSKEVNVRELLSAMLTSKAEPAAPSAPSSPLHVPALRAEGTPLPPPRMEGVPLIAKSNAPAKVEPVTKVEMPERSIPYTVQRTERPVAPGLPNRVEMSNPPPLNLIGHASTGTEPNINVPAAPATTPDKVPASALDSTPRGTVPYQLINTTHASVDYRIDRKGPSGVGKVEIYMTPDKGQTWHRLGEDADKRSPADINLPGDGVFGIRIVITNGNGFGGRAPVRGETAHCEIEVDTTSPFVQLRSADLMPSTGQVELRWNANDRNFGNAPINLFYRTQIDSPWQVVARGLKNDGLYRWAFPRDSNAQFFFRIEATDQAGNASQDVTRQPLVIDVSEPSVSVVGVTGSNSGGIRPVQGGN